MAASSDLPAQRPISCCRCFRTDGKSTKHHAGLRPSVRTQSTDRQNERTNDIRRNLLAERRKYLPLSTRRRRWCVGYARGLRQPVACLAELPPTTTAATAGCCPQCSQTNWVVDWWSAAAAVVSERAQSVGQTDGRARSRQTTTTTAAAKTITLFRSLIVRCSASRSDYNDPFNGGTTTANVAPSATASGLACARDGELADHILLPLPPLPWSR
jgi:hypothetical protein